MVFLSTWGLVNAINLKAQEAKLVHTTRANFEQKMNQGLACGELRGEAQKQIKEVRGDIKDNWELFWEENGRLYQFFDDLTDAGKEILGTLREESDAAVEQEQEDAKESFENSWDLWLVDEVHGVIIALRAETFEALKPYVDEGEKDAYDTWVALFLETLTNNKSLRSDNIQTRYNYRAQCYSKRTQKTYDHLIRLLERVQDKWSNEKLLDSLPRFLEKLEKMIEKVDDSDKPDAWKGERITLLWMVYDGIEEILEGLEVGGNNENVDDEAE